MPDLFGLDIAGIINDALGASLLDLTLTKVTPGTRTAGSLTDGTQPTSAVHAGKGFIEQKKTVRKDGDLIASNGRVVSVLGASLPSGVVPGINDKVTIEGTTYRVIEIVSRDPAAALYELLVDE